jgi:D-3-phosphoglycerate dehydrogenase
MKQTVVITAAIPRIATAILSREFEVVAHPTEGTRTENDLITLVAEADGIITMVTDPVTRRVLESNPNLRVVGNYGVGVDNIDLDAAREHGVVVTNTPESLIDATADLTMALLLAVARHMIPGDRMVRRGAFTGWDPLMLLGASLQQKRLGIIGMGRIGCGVARRALGFGMEVVYNARGRNEICEQALAVRRVELDELLATSDFISIHAPLTDETRHMIDRDAFARMKYGAYLVNTARGPIVDESALADALIDGRLAGAGLDVYENEPAVEPRLLTLDNVVLLPHLGSATEEARSDMARTAAEDVAAVLSGRQPRYRVV